MKTHKTHKTREKNAILLRWHDFPLTSTKLSWLRDRWRPEALSCYLRQCTCAWGRRGLCKTAIRSITACVATVCAKNAPDIWDLFILDSMLACTAAFLFCIYLALRTSKLYFFDEATEAARLVKLVVTSLSHRSLAVTPSWSPGLSGVWSSLVFWCLGVGFLGHGKTWSHWFTFDIKVDPHFPKASLHDAGVCRAQGKLSNKSTTVYYSYYGRPECNACNHYPGFASSPVRERPSDILEDVEALSKRSNQPWPHWLKGDSLKNSLRLLGNLTGSTPKKVIPTNGI
jgi:hypothetical protein